MMYMKAVEVIAPGYSHSGLTGWTHGLARHYKTKRVLGIWVHFCDSAHVFLPTDLKIIPIKYYRKVKP